VIVTQAELLQVKLTSAPLPPLDPQPQSGGTPQTQQAQPSPPLMPPLASVALASPDIAFAVPLEAPVQIVPAAQAAQFKATAQTNTVVAAPLVQPLTYGIGEGRQPAPHYPREAVRSGQEGKVAVRFAVGENGRVLSAETVTPSPWPLLNEEAVRTVRQRWRFRNGPARLYEVTIRFELHESQGKS